MEFIQKITKCNCSNTYMVKFHEDFLLWVVSISEGPKNKIMRKSGIHSSVPCRDSTLEQFLFCWVSKKIEKHDVSQGLSFMAEVLFW